MFDSFGFVSPGLASSGFLMAQNIPTAGIILAAGCSQRMGYPKQLVRIGGRCLIEIVVEAALSSNLDRIALVLGHSRGTIVRHLADLPDTSRLKIVTNPRYSEGLSYSLCAGLREVEGTHLSVMFLLGDQPLIDASAINTLLTAFEHSNKDICLPVRGKNRGNPTIFTRKYYKAIKRLTGDTGARRIIRSNPTDVHEFFTRNPAYFYDIDTQADLTRLTEPERF